MCATLRLSGLDRLDLYLESEVISLDVVCVL